MARRTVIVTGAAGFLGSAIAVDLARDHSVIALDRRTPDRALRDATPGVDWQCLDIADRGALLEVARGAWGRAGPIDVVIHLAAYYHFDRDAREEYQRTNVEGTSSVVDAAIEGGARRLIFASSMTAMLPPPPGEELTEHSPTAAFLPYGASKVAGERIVGAAADRLPSITLRIGGVFSDWCELPPLYGLIEMWAGRPPMNRIVVGEGNTGMPYVHRRDLVRLVRRCIERDRELASHEVLLASQEGAVRHRELFEILHGPGARPIHLSCTTARFGLGLRRTLGRVTRRMPFERPWMLQFIDRPWVADTRSTREKLDWSCTPALDIRRRLPVLLEHLRRERPEWRARKAARLRRAYRHGDPRDDVDANPRAPRAGI